jgi:hypothetical protein
MDIVYLLLIAVLGLSLLALIAACRALEERRHGR